MTIISQRKHALTFASAVLLLPAYSLGLISGLQQTPSTSTCFSRRPISIHHQSTCLWSSSVADETSDLSEDQSYQAYDWDDQFEELQLFMSEYGHCNFPQNPSKQLKKKYPMLKRFCQEQRKEYKQLQQRKSRGSGMMSLAVFDRDVRCRRLKELGFEFSLILASWYDHYHELIQYSSENGHIRVTERENKFLANWVYCQRKRRKKIKGFPRLCQSQIKLLDDIGFEWISELLDELWNTKYKQLVAYRNEHGHLMMEHSDPLYRWMDQQRQKLGNQKRYGTITEEQIRLLDEIEFQWKAERYDFNWHEKYDNLQRFQKQHGHCQPSRSTHRSLLSWCDYQRKKYHNGGLSKEQIKLLDQIGFPWDGQRNMWAFRYTELCEFCNEHGHLGVGKDDHPYLYDWMTTQRERYHGTLEPSLSDTQIEKLEEIQFCWSLDWRDRTWHEKYMEAVEFFKEHGHVEVIPKENLSLYNWIQTQAKRYKKVEGQKPFSEEEFELLEQLDFPFLEGQPRMAWNGIYAEVARYRGENDGRFPRSHNDDRDLSRWMRQQRHRYRCAFGYVPLSDGQKSLLESIDFPMYPESKTRRLWYEKYDELVEFRKEQGHFLVGKSENASLFRWIDKQRMSFKGALFKFPLSKLQIYLLERIGFPWSSDRTEIKWQEGYEELVEFGKEHGHLRVRQPENPKLWHWTNNQRKRYRGAGDWLSELSEYEFGQLEKIGFEWSSGSWTCQDTILCPKVSW